MNHHRNGFVKEVGFADKNVAAEVVDGSPRIT